MLRVSVTVLGILIALLLVMIARRDAPSGGQAGPEAEGERIVSLAPNLTEVVVMLGASTRLVGVTRFCEGVDESLPRLGGYRPDYEKILSLRPDRVLAIFTEVQKEGLEFLRRHGITVEVFRAESIADVRDVVTRLGESLGARGPAQAFTERLDTALRAPPPPVDAPRVLFLVEWGPPHFVAGGPSFITAMLEAAGARNVFEDAEKSYLPVDAERIVERNPDIIVDVTLLDTSPPGHWAPLSQLESVREGRVYGFPPVRPGTRIPEWIDRLREIVRPRQHEVDRDNLDRGEEH